MVLSTGFLSTFNRLGPISKEDPSFTSRLPREALSRAVTFAPLVKELFPLTVKGPCVSTSPALTERDLSMSSSEAYNRERLLSFSEETVTDPFIVLSFPPTGCPSAS